RPARSARTAHRRAVPVLTVAALLAAASAVPAGASDPSVFVCNAETWQEFRTRTTYPGDVLLDGCGLWGVHVQGDVHVTAPPPEFGGDWPELLDVRVDGDVVVQDAIVWLSDVTVGGDVLLVRANEVLISGRVAGRVRGTTGTLWSSADVGGIDVRFGTRDRGRDFLPGAALDDEDGGLQLREAHVRGPVTTRGGAVTLAETVVDGPLTSSSPTGVVLAETAVGGAVTVRDAYGRVVLGGLRRSDGPWHWIDDGQQRQSRYGSLTLERTLGRVEVEHTDVTGDLTCVGNALPVLVDPATTTVGGARTGDCA
ncbi:hypothetical protein AB6N23_17315, partial [Cellulomonas sp. 179-A 9B4 NHS]|uniref:hypothetical protein n=1 Tax=Cellulomonas sp. 179-A 9B4 NHS TaxID=3142379 RepID=UPI0039A1B415